MRTVLTARASGIRLAVSIPALIAGAVACGTQSAAQVGAGETRTDTSAGFATETKDEARTSAVVAQSSGGTEFRGKASEDGTSAGQPAPSARQQSPVTL